MSVPIFNTPYLLRIVQEEPVPKTVLINQDRTPVGIVLNVRESTTAPGRLKVAPAVPVSDEEGAPLAALSPEFRLEMN